MKGKTKLLVILVAVLVIVLVVLVQNATKTAQQGAQTTAPRQSQTGLVNQPSYNEAAAKAGNVDEIVNALDTSYGQDIDIAQQSDADIDYVNQSANLINPNDIYDANSF